MFVFHAQVATVQEAVFVDDLGRGCRVVVIAFHGVVTSVAHFTLYAYRTFFARFRIDHADFGEFVITAYRIVADFRRIVDARMCHAGRCFRQPVYAGHAHEHFFFHLLHQFHRAKGACHDAGAEGGQVEHAEHRVIELGDEHGRNAVKGRAPFLVDGGEYDQRIEFFDHDLCASMRQDVHGGEHDTEAVEQRHAAA